MHIQNNNNLKRGVTFALRQFRIKNGNVSVYNDDQPCAKMTNTKLYYQYFKGQNQFYNKLMINIVTNYFNYNSLTAYTISLRLF